MAPRWDPIRQIEHQVLPSMQAVNWRRLQMQTSQNTDNNDKVANSENLGHISV